MKSLMLKSPAIADHRTGSSFRKTKAKASRAAKKKADRPAHKSRQPIGVFNTLVPGRPAGNQLLQRTQGETVEFPRGIYFKTIKTGFETLCLLREGKCP